MKDLTPLQAYASMFEFLGQCYDTVHNDTLGAVLESMRLKRETSLPVNPSMRTDWLDLIHASKLDNREITSPEGYMLMEEFLRKLSLQIGTPGLQQVIGFVALNEHQAEVQRIWDDAVAVALEKYDDWEE